MSLTPLEPISMPAYIVSRELAEPPPERALPPKLLTATKPAAPRIGNNRAVAAARITLTERVVGAGGVPAGRSGVCPGTLARPDGGEAVTPTQRATTGMALS